MALRSSDRMMPLSGLLFFALIVAGFGGVGGDTPDSDARAAKVVAFYDVHYGRQIAAAVLVVLAGLFFVLFASALRARLAAADADAHRTASVLQASGTIFATGLAIMAGVHIALADAAHNHMAAAASALNQLDSDVFVVSAMPLLLFVATLAVLGLRFAVLPRWVGWTAVVLAVAMVTPAGWFAMMLSALLVAVVSVWLTIEASRAAAPAPPLVPGASPGAVA